MSVGKALDPLTVRQKNFYALRAGGILGKKKGAANQSTPYGQQIEDFVLHELVDDLVVRSDYPARRDWNLEPRQPRFKKRYRFDAGEI